SAVLRRPVRHLYGVSRLLPRCVCRGEPRARYPARRHQHGRPHHQQPDDGAGGARGAAGPAPPVADLSRRDHGARGRVPRHQGRRVLPQVRGAPRAGRDVPVRARASAPRADFFLALLHHDRPPRDPHDHRDWRAARDVDLGMARPDYERLCRADRDQRPLLALRRHRVDLPVPAAVSDREARMSPHIVPTRVYYLIFAILMICTALTVGIAFVDLGPFNVVAALTIAVFKATLVVLFFMHVKYGTRLTWAVVAGSVFWLGILLALTMGHYLTRPCRTYGWGAARGGQINTQVSLKKICADTLPVV